MQNRGQSLLELLVVIGVIAVIGAVGAQIFFVGARSQQLASRREDGTRLIEEAFEAVRNVSLADWQNIVTLTKGTTQYHPAVSSGAWTIASASEDIVLNGVTYTRSLTVQNVCRYSTTVCSDGSIPQGNVCGITDTSGGATTCTTSGGNYDASTEQVTATVTWSGDNISLIQYVTRWQNKACAQTAWNTVGAGPSSDCTTLNTLYDSTDGHVTVGTGGLGGAMLQIQ